MTDFAKQMHRKAENLASLMEKESRRCRSVPNWNTIATASDGSVCTNVKPFYSPYANFEPDTCEVVVIGVNPGGKPRNPDTITTAYLDDLNKPRGEYNAYLDETWEYADAPDKPGMQQGLRQVFQALYAPETWKRQLRYAASFNVCPLRTNKAKHIPNAVWQESVRWCIKVLGHLQPERIICISNYGWKTPWNVVDGPPQANANFCRDVRPTAKGFPNFVLADKAGHPKLNGCEIISTPHLSKISDLELKKTVNALQEHANSN